MRHLFSASRSVRLATAVALCGVVCSAQADISKCIDNAGRISYSDGMCANGVVIGHLDIDAVTPAPRAPVVAPVAPDPQPVRETAWATRSIAPHGNRTDAETVAAARATLAASDRALATLRSQNVAAR